MLSIAGYFSLLSNSIRGLPTKNATDAWAQNPSISGPEAAQIGKQVIACLKAMLNAVNDGAATADGSIGSFYAQIKPTNSLLKLEQIEAGLSSMVAANPAIPLHGFEKHWEGIRKMVEAINEDYVRVTGLLLGIRRALSPDQWKLFYAKAWNTKIVQPGAAPLAAMPVKALLGDVPDYPPPPPAPEPEKEIDFGDFKIDLENGRGEYELPNGDELYVHPSFEGGNPSIEVGYSSTSWMDEVEDTIEAIIDWISDVWGS